VTLWDRISGNERDKAAKLVLEAYLVMLQIPHSSSLRLAAQSTMAKCRDFIAEAVRLDPERVQDLCEVETYGISEQISAAAPVPVQTEK
jgi:hypothetical protein